MYGKTNFFLWVYRNLEDNKEFSLVTDQFYSPTLNTILVKGIREIYDKEISGIIHFLSRDRISRYDFGLIVANVYGLDKNLIKEEKCKILNV